MNAEKKPAQPHIHVVNRSKSRNDDVRVGEVEWSKLGKVVVDLSLRHVKALRVSWIVMMWM